MRCACTCTACGTRAAGAPVGCTFLPPPAAQQACLGNAAQQASHNCTGQSVLCVRHIVVRGLPFPFMMADGHACPPPTSYCSTHLVVVATRTVVLVLYVQNTVQYALRAHGPDKRRGYARAGQTREGEREIKLTTGVFYCPRTGCSRKGQSACVF